MIQLGMTQQKLHSVDLVPLGSNGMDALIQTSSRCENRGGIPLNERSVHHEDYYCWD